MYTFTIYDYLVLAFVLLFSVFIGLYQAVKSKLAKGFKSCFRSGKIEFEPEKDGNENGKEELKEYLVANSSMNSLPIAFSLLASSFSATALLGFPAEVYQYGIQFWMATFGLMFTPVIGAFATGPFFARLKVMSVFEYLKLRYDSNIVRLLAVTCYFIRNMLSISIFIYGPTTAVTALTRISTPVTVILIGGISTLYTTVGGIKAVIYTDVFQMIVMFAGLITVLVKGLVDLGGFENLWQISSDGGRLNFFDFDPNPFIRQSFWSLVIGNLFHYSMQYCLDQQMVQRFAAAKNIRSAQIAFLLNVPGMILFITLCCFSGLVIYATYSNCDPLSAASITDVKSPNQLLTYFIADKLKFLNGMVGLFLASILSGSLSSISSCLNSLSAIVLEDFLKRLQFFRELSDKKTTLTAKLIVIVSGVLCTALALVVSNIGGNLVQISATLNGAFNSPIIGVFILACVFPFSNEIGAIAGLFFGFAMALWLSFGTYIKQPIYPKLNVSTECYNETFVVQNISSLVFQLSKSDKEAMNLYGFDRFYSLSYTWFSAFGIFVTLFTGLVFSLLAGCNRKHVEPHLVIFKCLAKFQRTHKDKVQIEEIAMK